jgi:hypothetical protein
LITGLSLHFAAYAGEDILHHVILWLNSDAGRVTEVVSSILFNCRCLCSLPLPLYVEKKQKTKYGEFLCQTNNKHPRDWESKGQKV